MTFQKKKKTIKFVWRIKRGNTSAVAENGPAYFVPELALFALNFIQNHSTVNKVISWAYSLRYNYFIALKQRLWNTMAFSWARVLDKFFILFFQLQLFVMNHEKRFTLKTHNKLILMDWSICSQWRKHKLEIVFSWMVSHPKSRAAIIRLTQSPSANLD